MLKVNCLSGSCFPPAPLYCIAAKEPQPLNQNTVMKRRERRKDDSDTVFSSVYCLYVFWGFSGAGLDINSLGQSCSFVPPGETAFTFSYTDQVLKPQAETLSQDCCY